MVRNDCLWILLAGRKQLHHRWPACFRKETTAQNFATISAAEKIYITEIKMLIWQCTLVLRVAFVDQLVFWDMEVYHIALIVVTY